MKRIETADGISLAVGDEGDGAPVVLLHGFPDSSYVWRNQVPVLNAAGHRVIVPDLRGFGDSDMPPEVEASRITTIANDVVSILDALEIERADVVGHDWGAGLAWVVAGLHPGRVNRLVTMSVGHPNTQSDPPLEQREKSWYMLWFQLRDSPKRSCHATTGGCCASGREGTVMSPGTSAILRGRGRSEPGSTGIGRTSRRRVRLSRGASFPR